MVETRSAHVLETEPTPVHPATTKAYKEATEPTLAARAGGRRAPSLRRWHGLSDAQAYTAVALGHLLLAVPLIFSWKLVTKAAFGKAADPPEDQHGHLLHLYASALCSSAAVAFALEELARGRMLHTFTADTLKLGLIGHGIAWFTLFVNYPATWSFTAMLVETVACLATAGLPASQLLLTRQDRNRVWRDFRVRKRAGNAFTCP